jgi:diguanylate cyclase (GGDEF)-like protein/PAS domain S-box-containing protein
MRGILEGADLTAVVLQYFAQALNDAPVSLFVQDRHLRYVWVHNPFPGLSTEDMIGRTDTAFLSPHEAREIEEIKREVLQQEVPRRLKARMTIKNQAYYFDLMLQPWRDEDGKVAGITGTALDVSEVISAADASLAVGEDGSETLPFSVDTESRARLLASLSRSFAETGNDFPAILETITHLVAGVAGDACIIRLSGEESHTSARMAHYYVNPPYEVFFRSLFKQVAESLRMLLEEPMAQDGKAVVVQDLMSQIELIAQFPERVQDWLTAYPIHALMILPLRTTRRVLGTFTVWRSRQPIPYSFEEQAFWQDVADRAALAIENARLYADEVQRNRQLNALHDATSALLSTLDLEVLLGRILDAAQQAIPAAEQGVLYLVAPRTGRLEVRATTGFGDPRIRRVGLLQNSHANRAIREQRPLLIRNAHLEGLRNEPDLEELELAQGEIDPGDQEASQGKGHRAPDPDSFRSAILAPLILGQEVLGTLSLASSRPFAFDQSDLQLLVSFAATTTAAMHNAMLHTELQRIAITDPLTGLYNRRGLIELGRHEVERFQRFGQPLSAIMLDIDHFKNVNDTYGHSAGDQVLCGLAERCRALVRQIDILGRYGGEEFAILLPETDLFQASSIADRLRRAMEETPFFTEQGPVKLTISLGVSRAGHNLTNLVSLIEQADLALYQAKQKGRNRVELG